MRIDLVCKMIGQVFPDSTIHLIESSTPWDHMNGIEVCVRGVCCRIPTRFALGPGAEERYVRDVVDALVGRLIR